MYYYDPDMNNKYGRSPLEKHVEELRMLVKERGITDAEELSREMGISVSRVAGLARLAEVEIANVKPWRYARRRSFRQLRNEVTNGDWDEDKDPLVER